MIRSGAIPIDEKDVAWIYRKGQMVSDRDRSEDQREGEKYIRTPRNEERQKARKEKELEKNNQENENK